MLPAVSPIPSAHEYAASAARVSLGLTTIAVEAAGFGITTDALGAHFLSGDVLPRAEVIASDLRNVGAGIQAQALPLLEKALSELEGRIGQEMGTPALLKLIETLHRVSGIAEKQVETRKAKETKPDVIPFVMNINFGGKRQTSMTFIPPDEQVGRVIDGEIVPNGEVSE